MTSSLDPDKVTSAKITETSVTNNCPFQDCVTHKDDQIPARLARPQSVKMRPELLI